MSKHEDPPGDAESRSGKGRRGSLYVIRGDGNRQRFLRGMITSGLVRRGLGFDASYAVASAVRARLSDRTEVQLSEVRSLVAEELRNTVDDERLASLKISGHAGAGLEVVTKGQRQPFSLGLLARSVGAAGLELDRAYQLATKIEAELRRDPERLPSNHEIARLMAALLEKEEGLDAARRYRLVRRIHHLPRPLVIYIGGASGTGKSTLAVELAPLLRIFRIISTDTIRQVMRMVFTPAILPALHTSSFEAASSIEDPAERSATSDPASRVIAGFEEQATRVCVGIRAVVERAVAENMSIIVEGVHLHPGMVPFPDLDGSAYQVALTLATLNEEVHRPRFLMRSRRGRRAADRYLENFPAIRTIHDHLIHEAEALDAPLMDTSDDVPPVDRIMRLVTGMIERRLPHLAVDESSEIAPRVPTLVLCIDGLADRPVRALGERTPLEAAKTPTLDRLAREGVSGLADPVGPGVVPDTASGTLAIFGQSPLALRRGPVEALGAGMKLKPGDLALRGNLATLDEDGKLIDRRAGRIREGAAELAAALDGMKLSGGSEGDVVVRVRPSTEHRIAIVFRGPGLSSSILGSDPGEGSEHDPPLTPRPNDPGDPAAVRTAELIRRFEKNARKVLSDHPVNRKRRKRGLPVANAVLTRGAGHVHHLVSLEVGGEPLRLTCVGGDRTVRGISVLLGGETIATPEMTANLDTDIDAKFRLAGEALEKSDLVVVHVKGADVASHDRRPDLKVAFLERLDASLGKWLENAPSPLRIAVVSDHATLSESGQHAADPPPVLVWGTGIEADDVEAFDEASAKNGSLKRFPLRSLLWRLFGLD